MAGRTDVRPRLLKAESFGTDRTIATRDSKKQETFGKVWCPG
jgi:hypothetical protein